MSRFDWHARYHQDALDGMLSLSLEERGAYNTLLDLIYSRGAAVPDDCRWLAGWMKCPLKRWNQLRAALIEKGKIYVVEVNGSPCLMNARAQEEITSAKVRREKLKNSGSSGGRKSAQVRAEMKENKDISEASAEASLKLRQDKTLQEEEDANASLSTPAADAALRTPYPEAFDLAWRAYPHIRGRSSKPKSLAAWRRIPVSERDRLPVAVNRYAREGREPKQDCGAPAFDRWLRDARHLDWLTDDVAASESPASPAVLAHRQRHFRETGEWRSEWGEKPAEAAA